MKSTTSRSTSLALAAALALTFTIASPARAATVGLNLFLKYNTYQDQPGFDGYVLFPNLHAEPSRATLTSLSSPTGTFLTNLNPGETFSGASSGVIADFADYKALVDTTGWTFTIDADTATPTTYLFDVLASGLTDWATVHAVLAAGLQGATYLPGSSPTFTWTGPSGFDHVTVGLSGMNFGEYMDLAPGATSYTTMASLAPGDYTFNVNYVMDLFDNPPLTVTTPMDGAVPFADWNGLEGLQVSVFDQVTFTVVPEPGSAALMALAAGGLFAFRRRRERSPRSFGFR